MFTVLLVIHVIITLAMIVIILLQRSSSGIGSMGGGMSAGFMTSRGQANLLTRTTTILATLFILNSLALSWLTQQDAPSRSLIEQMIEDEAATMPEVPMPVGEVEAPAPDAPMPATVPEIPRPE